MTERRWTFNLATLKSSFRNAYNAAEALMAQGGEWELVLRPRKSKRSQEQNRRYWAMLREIAATVWLMSEVPAAVGKSYQRKTYSDEAWHEFFKRELIGCEELPGGGLVGISTTTLSVAEFASYMERIEHWCGSQGFPVMLEAA